MTTKTRQEMVECDRCGVQASYSIQFPLHPHLHPLSDTSASMTQSPLSSSSRIMIGEQLPLDLVVPNYSRGEPELAGWSKIGQLDLCLDCTDKFVGMVREFMTQKMVVMALEGSIKPQSPKSPAWLTAMVNAALASIFSEVR